MPCSALIDPPTSANRSVDQAIDPLPLAEEGVRVGADRLAQVEVDVAVPDMAEGADPHAGDFPLDQGPSPVP